MTVKYGGASIKIFNDGKITSAAGNHQSISTAGQRHTNAKYFILIRLWRNQSLNKVPASDASSQYDVIGLIQLCQISLTGLNAEWLQLRIYSLAYFQIAIEILSLNSWNPSGVDGLD